MKKMRSSYCQRPSTYILHSYYTCKGSCQRPAKACYIVLWPIEGRTSKEVQGSLFIYIHCVTDMRTLTIFAVTLWLSLNYYTSKMQGVNFIIVLWAQLRINTSKSGVTKGSNSLGTCTRPLLPKNEKNENIHTTWKSGNSNQKLPI